MKKIIWICAYIILIFSLTGCTPAMQEAILSINDGIKDSIGVKDDELDKEEIFFKVDLQTHSGKISALALTKDKSLLVSAGSDGDIRVWDIQTGKMQRKISGYIGADGTSGIIQAMALSSDDRYLAVGGLFSKSSVKAGNMFTDDTKAPGAIRIYDFKTGQQIYTLKDHHNAIKHLKFSPDNRILVSSSFDSKINIWDAGKQFQLLNTIKTHNHPRGITEHDVTQRGFDYFITSVGYDRIVALNKFNIQDNSVNLIKALQTSYYGYSVTFSQNYIVVATNSYRALNDAEILLFDRKLNLIKKIDLEKGVRPYRLRLTSDERFLIHGGDHSNMKENQGNYVHIYDIKDNFKEIKTTVNAKETVFDLEMIDNNTIIYSNTKINMYKIDTMQSIDRFKSDFLPIVSIGVDNNNNIAYGNTAYGIDKASQNDRGALEYSFNLNTNKISKLTSTDNFARLSDTSGTLFLGRMAQDEALVVFDSGQIKKVIPFALIHPGSVLRAQGFYKDFYVAAAGMSIDFIKQSCFTCLPDTSLAGHFSDVYGFVIQDDRLYSASIDGTIKIWDLKDVGKKEIILPLASIHISNNKEWVMWTPEGYFNVSSEKYNSIGYHINQGPTKNAIWIEMDKLYDHFFRPDLVKLKLQGEDISKYTGGVTYKEVLKNLPPTVSIASVNGSAINKTDKKANLSIPTAKLSFNVAENNGGSGLIRIYQEGKLVKTIGSGQVNRQSADADVKAQEAQIDKKSKEAQTIYLAKVEDTVTKSLGREFNANELVETVTINNGSAISTKGTHTIELPLKAGNNTISIEAFNKTNTVASYRDSVNINASIKPKEPKIYAIALGVNEFEQSSVSPLKYSENDAKVIAEKIKKATSYQTDVTLLTGTNMTKENIQKTLQSIKAKAGLEDKVIFYVSTHGKAVNGNLFLVPQNNKSVKNWINFEELFKEVQSISALDQIFVIDACESGKASDIMASVYDAKTSVLAKQSGVHVLMATTKGTFAFEHPDKNVQHGVFTYNILKALDDPRTDKNADKWISVVELSKTLQEPANNAEHQFPIIRNVGQDTQIRNLK